MNLRDDSTVLEENMNQSIPIIRESNAIAGL